MSPPDPELSTAILVLAAGASSRMGQAKQLLPYGRSTLLGHAIAQAREAAIGEVFCVVGARAELILPEVESMDVEVVVNTDWEEGLSSSIRAGIRAALARSPQLGSALIMLADQPLIHGKYLKTMCEVHRDNPGKIIASSYGEKVGVPALFPATFFAQLQELKGDVGARKLLLQQSDHVIRLDAKDLLGDIDTPADYQWFRQQFKPGS